MGDAVSTNQGSDRKTIKTDPKTHTRSTLQFFWVGMAIFLIIMVVLGFGSTYGYQLVMGQEISGAGVVEADWAIHIHAAVYIGWMVLLLAQTVFIVRGRMKKHMAVGKTVGIGLACGILLAGIIIVIVQYFAIVREGFASWAEWPTLLLISSGSITGLINFSILFYLGFSNRKQPEPHKRYMIFATITLVIASTSRMNYLLGPDLWAHHIGTFLMVAPIIGYDLYTERRIHKSTLIGTALVWGAVVVNDLLELLR